MITYGCSNVSDTASHESKFEEILSMRVLEWLVSLVGCKIFGIIWVTWVWG